MTDGETAFVINCIGFPDGDTHLLDIVADVDGSEEGMEDVFGANGVAFDELG